MFLQNSEILIPAKKSVLRGELISRMLVRSARLDGASVHQERKSGP
eukprot:SAG31_NODE_22453_length_525_cov_0.730047_1_plen_45_part_10